MSLLASDSVAQTFIGPIRVVDGDTLDLGLEWNFRLHGIDAPELGQTCGAMPCGAYARDWLAEQLDGERATCIQVDWDSRYNRPVARCTVSGEDVGRMMVLAGYAQAYLKYSADYALDEKEAALSSRGFWAEGFGDPATHRAAQRRSSSPAICIVKGNISPNSGEKIYHVAGQRHYENVSIRPEKGEACFDTEAEAKAAGWRRARR